ncbi:MAG: hypothetical protein R2748_11485 [Bryobacterales bacterium]
MEQRCPNCFHAGATDVCPACGWTENAEREPDALPLGTKLGDARLVGGVLRRTARGFVYRGWDERLELDLAIEEYFPKGVAERREDGSVGRALEGSGAESFAAGRERFLDESRRLMQLGAAPGLAAVADVVQEAGTAYRVTRLLDGIWLAAFLARRSGGITREPALRILRPVLDALEAAHEAGVTHGAVSTDTVMLCRSGEVKLLDFTGDGTPEQDLRAAAALFYRLMTGEALPDEGPLDAKGLEGLERHERQALEGVLRDASGKGIASVRAFREALDAPPPVQPVPVQPSAVRTPTPAPAAETPPPDPEKTRLLEPEDLEKTRILMDPSAAAAPEPDPMRTRILEPPKPAAPAARDQTPTVVLPKTGPQLAQIPQQTRRPPLSPVFVAVVALLGLIVLGLLAWLPYRYFSSLDGQQEEQQTEAQTEEQAEAAPAAAPEPVPPDLPAPETPAQHLRPSRPPRLQPGLRHRARRASPPPQPMPRAAPQPASAGLDPTLVGVERAHVLEWEALRLHAAYRRLGRVLHGAGRPGCWAREQGRLRLPAALGACWVPLVYCEKAHIT